MAESQTSRNAQIPEFRFSKQMRLLKPSEFDRVMRARVSAADGSMRLYAAANALGHARLGLTVSRRMGNSVARNIWKRALREAFRLSQHELPPCDVVCIPHREADPDIARLRASLAALTRRLDEQLRRRRGAR